MKTVCSFVAKFASLISWEHSCFDRVIFKGYLPFRYAEKFEAFVDYVLKMRRADFMEVTAPKHRSGNNFPISRIAVLVGWVERLARPTTHLQGLVGLAKRSTHPTAISGSYFPNVT